MYVHGKPKEPQAPVKKFALPFDLKRGEKKEKSKRVGVRRPLKHKIPRAVRKNRAERMANQSYFDGSVPGLLVVILRSGITIAGAMLLSGVIHYLLIAKGWAWNPSQWNPYPGTLSRILGNPSTLVVMLVNAIIMSYASCHVMVLNIQWVCSHRVIAGRRQNFIGTTTDLFSHTIRWSLGWVGLGVASSMVDRIPVPIIMVIPIVIMVWYALFVTLSFIKWVTSNTST